MARKSTDNMRFDDDTFGTVHATRFPELNYQRQGDAWRILDAETGSNIGPIYPTRVELLADLERYAGVFGCKIGNLD